MTQDPRSVRQITPEELRSMMDSKQPLELLDVRTDAERKIAQIAGARHLDQKSLPDVQKLPKDTLLVFHCHHGGRSQAAAQFFVSQGFTNVCNLAGGIDAWSVAVDPSVKRY
jgi:monothiol glutaredoxin